MTLQSWSESRIRFFGLAGVLLSGVGALAGLFIVLVRVPSLAQTRLEELMGSLLAIGMSLQFIILGCLVCLLTVVVIQAHRRSNDLRGDQVLELKKQPSPDA